MRRELLQGALPAEHDILVVVEDRRWPLPSRKVLTGTLGPTPELDDRPWREVSPIRQGHTGAHPTLQALLVDGLRDRDASETPDPVGSGKHAQLLLLARRHLPAREVRIRSRQRLLRGVFLLVSGRFVSFKVFVEEVLFAQVLYKLLEECNLKNLVKK